jgi:hypothetical protein
MGMQFTVPATNVAAGGGGSSAADYSTTIGSLYNVYDFTIKSIGFDGAITVDTNDSALFWGLQITDRDTQNNAYIAGKNLVQNELSGVGAVTTHSYTGEFTQSISKISIGNFDYAHGYTVDTTATAEKATVKIDSTVLTTNETDFAITASSYQQDATIDSANYGNDGNPSFTITSGGNQYILKPTNPATYTSAIESRAIDANGVADSTVVDTLSLTVVDSNVNQYQVCAVVAVEGNKFWVVKSSAGKHTTGTDSFYHSCGISLCSIDSSGVMTEDYTSVIESAYTGSGGIVDWGLVSKGISFHREGNDCYFFSSTSLNDNYGHTFSRNHVVKIDLSTTTSVASTYLNVYGGGSNTYGYAGNNALYYDSVNGRIYAYEYLYISSWAARWVYWDDTTPGGYTYDGLIPETTDKGAIYNTMTTDGEISTTYFRGLATGVNGLFVSDSNNVGDYWYVTTSDTVGSHVDIDNRITLTTTYEINDVLHNTTVLPYQTFFIANGNTVWSPVGFAISNATLNATRIHTELINTMAFTGSWVETDGSGFAASEVLTKSVYDSYGGSYASPTWTHYRSDMFLQT